MTLIIWIHWIELLSEGWKFKMDKKIVGVVTGEERKEIMILIGRKSGIEELKNSLKSNLLSEKESRELKSKMVYEMEKVTLNIQNWWNMMYEKYQWESSEGHNWAINFDTCEIYID